jgi:glucans biosynthesis protein C
MTERKNYIDACRAGLMLLGIPIHAAMVYQLGPGWLVSSPDKSHALTYVVRWIHSFRMPVFFLIAGYFSILTVRRHGDVEWLRSRLKRLGIPLCTAALLFGPLQSVFVILGADLVSQGAVQPGVFGRVVRQLTSDPGAWIQHLWFLVDLLVLSATLVAVRVATAAAGRSLPLAPWIASYRRHARLAGALGLACYAIIAAFLGTRPRAPLLGVIDLFRLMGYGPFFAIGMLAAVHPTLFGLLTRPSHIAWLLGLSFTALTAFSHEFEGQAAVALRLMLIPANGLLMAHLLLSATSRWLSAPSSTVRAAANGAFTVYLVHQPIIVLLGFLFLFVDLNVFTEFAAIVLITTAASFAAHRAVSRNGLLRFLFNGVRSEAEPQKPVSMAKAA